MKPYVDTASAARYASSSSLPFSVAVVAVLLTAAAPVARAQDKPAETAKPVPTEVVAVVPRSWPPQYGTDRDGKPTGFAIDVMEEVAKLAGTRVRYRLADSFPDAFRILRSGEADLIPNTGILAERRAWSAFTRPVETFTVSLIVRDDTHDIGGVDSLVGRSLAVVEKNIGQIMFGERKDIDIRLFNNVRSALFDLIAGHVDALVFPDSVLRYMARQIGIENRIKTVGPPLKEIKRGIQIRNGNEALVAALDDAVERFVGTPEYQRIYVKWYGQQAPYWTVRRLSMVMGGALVLVVVVMVGWRYQTAVKLNQALVKSDRMFRSFADNSPVVFSLKDAAGRYLRVNRRWQQVVGLSEADVEGHKAEDVRAKSSVAISTEHDAEVLATGRSKEYETTVPTREGERIFLNTRFPVYDERGVIAGVGATAIDITERKRAEEMLEDAIESLGEGFSLWDADDRLVLCNEKYRASMAGIEDILKPGVAFATLIRGLAERRLRPEAAGREDAWVHERLEQHRNPGGSFEIELADGTWMEIHEYRTKDGGIATVRNDITERKLADKALNESEDRLRRAVSNAPIPVIMHAEDGQILMVSDKWIELSGYTLAETPTIRDWREKAYGADPDRLKRHWEMVDSRYDRTRVAQHESHIITKSGEERTWDVHDAPLGRLPDGRRFVISMAVDVTERLRADENMRLAMAEAEQANQAKSEFLANISHELRTPLNAILGFSDILGHQHLGPAGEAKYREYAKDIYASGQHLLELVNDILDISTIESGKQSLAKEPLATAEIVLECVKFVADRAKDGGIALETDVPGDLPPLYADRRATKQILLNVLSNAVKFTPEGGRIDVSVTAANGNTSFAIADTGRGIKAEWLPRIIEPFARAGSDPFVTAEGWGLGLTITKSLIDLHEGMLDITSTPGEGTTVVVTLPNGGS